MKTIYAYDAYNHVDFDGSETFYVVTATQNQILREMGLIRETVTTYGHVRFSHNGKDIVIGNRLPDEVVEVVSEVVEAEGVL